MRIYFHGGKNAFRAGEVLSGAGGQDTSEAVEPDGRPGDLRLLFCRDSGESAAEDLAAPQVSARCGDRVGAARGKVDALPDRDAAAHGGRANSAADAGRDER